MAEQQNNEDFRNLVKQKPLQFAFNNNQFSKNSPLSKNDFTAQENSIPMVKSHRLQIRDGTLKFRLNDGNLRTARGFGKRSSLAVDPVIEKYVHNYQGFKGHWFKKLQQYQILEWESS